jgi:hypothetical protein
MMSQPPELPWKLSAVPVLVEELSGVKRSRATIYNWATRGVTVADQKVILETEMRAGQMFTTRSKVQAFLARINK